MSLEDLLAKVKDEKRQEEVSLKREHKNALENLDTRKRDELERVKKRLDNELEEKKRDLLEKKERQEAFNLKMDRLELKKELLDEAKAKVLEDMEKLSIDKKKEIYLSSLKEQKDLLNEADEIAVPEGKKKNLEPILKEAGIKITPKEKNLDFGEGFLVKGERWTVEVTLEEILEREISRNKKKFVNLLFGDL